MGAEIRRETKMPHYEYRCPKCNKNHTDFRSIENRRNPFSCPDCGTASEFIAFPQDSVKPEGRAAVKDVFRKV
jgi:putative FmdB family regulatory protein